MQICLQEPKAGTCVPCAVVNVLRHFHLDPDPEEVIQLMRMKKLHGRDGSTIAKAAKYLRREWGMDAIKSVPHHTITDPTEAAIEVAFRFEALLSDGRVGLLRRKETPKSGHAVVLHKILWERGEPYFVVYDSNKRDAGGHWVYKAEDYVVWTPDTQDVKIDLKAKTIETEEAKPTPTGRIGYFIKPGSLGIVKEPTKSPFRALNLIKRSTGADGPLEE